MTKRIALLSLLALTWAGQAAAQPPAPQPVPQPTVAATEQPAPTRPKLALFVAFVAAAQASQR